MAYANVQTSGKLSTTTGGGLSWTPGSAPTLNNLLTCREFGYDYTAYTNGATDFRDSSGTPKTGTRDVFQDAATGGDGGLSIYSMLVPSGLTTPVKNIQASPFNTAAIDEWSGNATSSIVDATLVKTTTSGAGTGNTNALSTGASAGLVLASLNQYGAANPENITSTGTSFTQDVAEQNGTTSPGAAVWRTASVASASITETWTWASSVNYRTVIASYNATGAAAGPVGKTAGTRQAVNRASRY